MQSRMMQWRPFIYILSIYIRTSSQVLFNGFDVPSGSSIVN